MKSLYTAHDIANYFIYKAKNENQELISHLKLQKLVYYAQGLHLALHGKPIFKEKIEAWNYGPVVPELYSKYKHYGAKGIAPEKTFNPESIDSKMREFLDEVFSAFGQFSAVGLMNLTHEDKCWKDAFPQKVIKHTAMATDLKKYLENG